jgi:uroporphyrinogen decarboxylase
MYNSPQTFHQLLELLTQAAIDLLTLQIQAGVQVVQIFDSWTNWLNAQSFMEFSLRYMEKIQKGISHLNVPVIFYFQGSSLLAPLAAEATPAAISLDWQCDLTHMRQTLPATIALQGNLDPCLLFADRPILGKAIDRLLHVMKDHPAYIFNLGHGVLPQTPMDHVRFLVDRIKGSES